MTSSLGISPSRSPSSSNLHSNPPPALLSSEGKYVRVKGPPLGPLGGSKISGEERSRLAYPAAPEVKDKQLFGKVHEAIQKALMTQTDPVIKERISATLNDRKATIINSQIESLEAELNPDVSLNDIVKRTLGAIVDRIKMTGEILEGIHSRLLIAEGAAIMHVNLQHKATTKVFSFLKLLKELIEKSVPRTKIGGDKETLLEIFFKALDLEYKGKKVQKALDTILGHGVYTALKKWTQQPDLSREEINEINSKISTLYLRKKIPTLQFPIHVSNEQTDFVHKVEQKDGSFSEVIVGTTKKKIDILEGYCREGASNWDELYVYGKDKCTQIQLPKLEPTQERAAGEKDIELKEMAAKRALFKEHRVTFWKDLVYQIFSNGLDEQIKKAVSDAVVLNMLNEYSVPISTNSSNDQIKKEEVDKVKADQETIPQKTPDPLLEYAWRYLARGYIGKWKDVDDLLKKMIPKLFFQNSPYLTRLPNPVQREKDPNISKDDYGRVLELYPKDKAVVITRPYYTFLGVSDKERLSTPSGLALAKWVFQVIIEPKDKSNPFKFKENIEIKIKDFTIFNKAHEKALLEAAYAVDTNLSKSV